MILSGEQSGGDQHASQTPERSTLSQAYLFFAFLAAIGGIGSIIFGIAQLSGTAIACGVGGIVFAVLLFGLSEFFQQVTRITAATEETARLMRDQRR
jgi:hypothetical protein